MTWRRLATFALGAAAMVVGGAIPIAGLAAPGAFLVGWALRWPGDRNKAKPRDELLESAPEEPTPADGPRR